MLVDVNGNPVADPDIELRRRRASKAETPPEYRLITGKPGQRKTTDPGDVAVVIPCHNYARYLGECLGSVMMQTHKPAEVIVIDDSSSDDPETIADTFSGRGVKYMRIDAGEVWEARRIGYEQTRSPVLCFLDADDILDPQYLEKGLEILKDPSIGIAYSDTTSFGFHEGTSDYPAEVTYDMVCRRNYLHAGSLVRRKALEISKAFSPEKLPADGAAAHADWWIWRNVMESRWRAVKSPGIYLYRRHEQSQMKNSNKRTWWDRYVMDQQKVALVVPLAGRGEHWGDMSRYLDMQAWPHDQIELILGVSGTDRTFTSKIKEWVCHCDYQDVRVVQFQPGREGLADLPRDDPGVAREVDDAMCRVWNTLTEGITSPWTWTLEDDVIPRYDVLPRMLRHVDPTVDAVGVPYLARQVHDFPARYVVTRGDFEDIGVSDKGKGVEQVTTCGFGCLLVRSSIIRNHVFWTGERGWYDHWFFIGNDLKVLVDWDLEARHLAVERPSRPQTRNHASPGRIESQAPVPGLRSPARAQGEPRGRQT